jgi:cardiolipin synthase
MTAAPIPAARRGVRVVALGPGKIDHHRPGSEPARLRAVFEAGIEIYEYRAALLHAKTMVVDGQIVTSGGTDLDNRSFSHNGAGSHGLSPCRRPPKGADLRGGSRPRPEGDV